MTANWDEVQLLDVCRKIGSGATPRGGKSSYKRSGIPLLRSQNVLTKGFSEDGLAFIDENQAAQLDNVIVEKDDVLLNITGDSVCRVCQVPDRFVPARVNQHVAIIRPTADVLDPRFLRYFLATPRMQAHMRGLASAGATRPALTKGMIEAFTVPAPALQVQHAIAALLGAIDDKIELNRRMNETLEAMARAIFKSWFIDFDPLYAKIEGRPSPGIDSDTAALLQNDLVDSEHGPIPKGWRWATLGDFCDLNPEKWKKSTLPESLNYIDLSSVKWGVFGPSQRYVRDEAPSRARRIVRDGDTLVGTVRPANGSYGLVVRAIEGLTASTGFAQLRPKKSSDVPFVYLAATSADSIRYFAQVAHGAAYPAVDPDLIISLDIPEGPPDLHAAFDAATMPLLSLKEHNELESRTLGELRDLLLPKLLSGEIRLKDAERQIEEVA